MLAAAGMLASVVPRTATGMRAQADLPAADSMSLRKVLARSDRRQSVPPEVAVLEVPLVLRVPTTL
jgi:hypothetical protein